MEFDAGRPVQWANSHAMTQVCRYRYSAAGLCEWGCSAFDADSDRFFGPLRMEDAEVHVRIVRDRGEISAFDVGERVGTQRRARTRYEVHRDATGAIVSIGPSSGRGRALRIRRDSQGKAIERTELEDGTVRSTERTSYECPPKIPRLRP